MKNSSAARVDLDDSEVVRVVREAGAVSIELEQRRGTTAKTITVSVSGAVREEAEYYVGNNVTAPHPNPEFPLDFVEYAAQGAGYLELGGYLKGDSWFTWRIMGAHVEIQGLPNDQSAT